MCGLLYVYLLCANKTLCVYVRSIAEKEYVMCVFRQGVRDGGSESRTTRRSLHHWQISFNIFIPYDITNEFRHSNCAFLYHSMEHFSFSAAAAAVTVVTLACLHAHLLARLFMLC